MVDVTDLKLIDQLSWYIVEHYRELMTPDELAALRGFNVQIKLTDASSEAHKGMLKIWAPETEKSKRLMESGVISFYDAVRDRVLSEHADQVVINRCPFCEALARTPRARQCPGCYKRW